MCQNRRDSVQFLQERRRRIKKIKTKESQCKGAPTKTKAALKGWKGKENYGVLDRDVKTGKKRRQREADVEECFITHRERITNMKEKNHTPGCRKLQSEPWYGGAPEMRHM